MTKPHFSVIVPVFNEEGNIERLYAKLKAVFELLGKPWEVIFVNDGSTDKSEIIIQQLQKSCPEIKLIGFTRNFGQTAAFAAGIDHAQGEIVVTMDADLQNDPDDLPKMVELMNQTQADVVTGWRKNRKDPFLRSFLSHFANMIISGKLYSQFHDLGCSLRIYKREVISNLKLYGEMHRFIPILASANGARIVEMPVNHHPRNSGKSKYGLMRTFKVILDLVTVRFLTDYQTKPIYMFGFTGFIFILLGFVSAFFILIRHFFFAGAWVSPMIFIMMIFFNIGVICILMGLLAEIQIRTWYESSGKKGYIIKNIKPQSSNIK